MRTFLVLTLSAVLLAITTAAHKPAFRHPAPPAPQLAPALIGQVVLSEGLGVVRHPSLHAGMLVIHSVFSPDSLSAGARVSVAQLDEGILVFWAHSADPIQTDDEPEVHFSVWNSSGPNIYP